MRRKMTVLGAAAAVVMAAGITVPLLATAGCTASSGGGMAASVAEVADSPGSGHAVADWNRTLIRP
jgi:hypothetical protein